MKRTEDWEQEVAEAADELGVDRRAYRAMIEQYEAERDAETIGEDR